MKRNTGIYENVVWFWNGRFTTGLLLYGMCQVILNSIPKMPNKFLCDW